MPCQLLFYYHSTTLSTRLLNNIHVLYLPRHLCIIISHPQLCRQNYPPKQLKTAQNSSKQPKTAQKRPKIDPKFRNTRLSVFSHSFQNSVKFDCFQSIFEGRQKNMLDQLFTQTLKISIIAHAYLFSKSQFWGQNMRVDTGFYHKNPQKPSKTAKNDQKWSTRQLSPRLTSQIPLLAIFSSKLSYFYLKTSIFWVFHANFASLFHNFTKFIKIW